MLIMRVPLPMEYTHIYIIYIYIKFHSVIQIFKVMLDCGIICMLL